jgi:hypothetical protein
MIKNVIALLALLTVGFIHAQQYELGKVTKDELLQKQHELEPDAPAAVLFESGKTYMDYSDQKGFMLMTEVDIKIKIYKKEGYEWANRSIPYYIGQSPIENVSISKAATYNLVNGSIEKTKLKSEGEFEEKTSKFWGRKKITMPNVKEGSIVEYRYTISSPYMGNVPAWQFQTSIPVNHSQYVTRFPEYYVYKTNFKGFVQPTVTKSSENRTYNYSSKEHEGQYVVKTNFSTGQLSFKELITTYVAAKMPSMKEEDYVSNINNYISTVEHELSMTKFPNQTPNLLSMTWEDLAKTIYESEYFGLELKKSGYFEDDIKALTAGQASNDEKTAAIFNYVKNRMNWNGYYGYNCDDGVRKAYKDKVGNVAEINLMLIAMLRQVGIPANPVLLSTRNHGISVFPNRKAYNYVVCAVESNNNVMLLDATDKNALPNILPVRALNWIGRTIRENGSSVEVNLMPTAASKDVVNVIAAIDGQGKLSGKLRDQYFDYNAFLYRDHYADLTNENYLESLERKYTGIEIADDYTVTTDDFSKPVIESYSFVHNNVSEVIGDKIYFSPLLFFTTKENPFKQDQREYPVDFVFPNQDKYMMTITLPDGYAIESMPAAAAVTLADGACKFSFNITSSGKQIQIASTIEVNEAIIGAEDYAGLRDFFKTMIAKQNEKIVLKKI